MSKPSRRVFWVLIPAAGVGRRMGGDRPKQFLMLGESSVLAHTLSLFIDHAEVRGVVLVLGEGVAPDSLDIPMREGRLFFVTGGGERVDSVRNGLEFLAPRADPDDWVLVHDAARPCLPREDLDRLMESLWLDPVGGLLAAPSTDTLKLSAADGTVERTLDRTRVWRALTPQMFRLAALREALRLAAESGMVVTDEAAAMENAGYRPRLVEGSAVNIKITRPEDLDAARDCLRRQGRLGDAT